MERGVYEECKCGARSASVERGVHSLKCKVWSVECGVRSAKCGARSVQSKL